MRQETPDAPVVEPCFKSFLGRLTARIVDAGPPSRHAVPGKFVEGIRPVGPIDEIEIGVSGVIRNRAPMLRILHAVDHRPVAAGRFSEAAAMLAACKRAEFPVDKRNDLARQIVSVVADRR